MQIIGSTDVDEAVGRYAKMLDKYVDPDQLPKVPQDDMDKDAYTTRYNSVLLYLVPHAVTTDVMFMGRTMDGINLRFTEAMEYASSERLKFLESMVIKTLAKKRGKDRSPVVRAVRGLMGWN